VNGPWLSVIIPVYREAGAIGSCLGLLSRCRRIERAEVIVVDGDNGSTRTPRDIMPVKVVSSAPGRGVQLNAGRRAAAADRLLFLHVDTSLPVNFVDLVCRALF
jgi:glycosyltransferase involved in cell wall biosynthesis